MMTRGDLLFRQAAAKAAYRRGVITAARYQQILLEIESAMDSDNETRRQRVIAAKSAVARILERRARERQAEESGLLEKNG